MRNRTGSRFISFLALVAVGLILLWRMHLLRDARPRPHSGSGPAEVSGTTPSASARDLSWDEQQGGHTLRRHVAIGESDLARRLEREAGVAAASSFTDRATAEEVVGRTLAREQERIAFWLRHEKESLALDYQGERGRAVGEVLLRGETRARPASDARIVLRKRGARYFVLTAYPVEP
ncbi:MAG: RNase A-like domain-containing protein [Thermoanaerobaculia bacterium]